MEVLSGVASGMAVASLSIQLLESVRKVKSVIRSVKGAPEELDRLVVSLDRLNALLQDVRDVMEQQASRQGQHFPAPSMTIYNCLKSCEDTLASFQTAVDQHTSRRRRYNSVPMRVKDDIRFGLQTEGIAAFEVRVHREISYLHASLATNTTGILMATIPALMASRPPCTGVCTASSRQQQYSIQPPAQPNDEDDMLSSYKVVGTNIRMRQFWIPSALNKVGIYQRQSVCYLRPGKAEARASSDEATRQISESYDMLFTWYFWGFGLQWVQHGKTAITSSLSVYPVVGDIWTYRRLVREGSLAEIQQALTSGYIHPFVRDKQGWSLLHLAAYSDRVDMCQFLVQIGLNPDITRSHGSPLECAMHPCVGQDETSQIDTIRYLLLQCNAATEFELGFEDLDDQFNRLDFLGPSTIQWLWYNASTVLMDHTLLHFRCRLLQALAHAMTKPDQEMSVLSLIVEVVTPEIVAYYFGGNFSLLQSSFYRSRSSLDSQRQGQVFLKMLGSLNLDIEECIAIELSLLPPGLSFYHIHRSRKKRIISETLEDQHRVLRWIWDLDPRAPGHLLVSEHVGLGPDHKFYPLFSAASRDAAYVRACWPFFSYPPHHDQDDSFLRDTQWENRFNRRQSKKTRKDRARTGQKRSQTMPGAWIW